MAGDSRGHAAHHCSALLHDPVHGSLLYTILYTAPYSTQSIVQCAGAGGAGAGAGDGISRSGGENTRDAEMRISSPSDLSGPDNSHHRHHDIGGSCKESQE